MVCAVAVAVGTVGNLIGYAPGVGEAVTTSSKPGKASMLCAQCAKRLLPRILLLILLLILLIGST
jgi:hypothetical protein